MARKPRVEYEITAEDKSAAALRQAQQGLAGFTSVARTATQVFGSFIGVASVGQLVTIADRFNQLSTRIRTATRDTGDFDRVQRALLQSSIATGASLESSVETFQALSRVREDIGATNEQMLVLNQTLQQLGVIGGSSTEAMRNGLLQFNQAIAAGVFRAEEFNSIVENLPELARRIADGFGVTQGQLRAMVIDGKLFSSDVINVLLQQAPEIASQFQEIPNNLDRSFSALGSSLASVISELDRAVGLTEKLADKVQDVASNVNAFQLNLKALDLSSQIAEIEKTLNGQPSKTFGQKFWDFLGLGGETVAQGLLPGAEERLRERLKQLIAERDALIYGAPEPGTVGEVSGGKAAGPSFDTLPASVRDAGRKRFEQLIKEEAEYLKTEQELRLRTAQELNEALKEEEKRFREESLALAAGFDSIEQQEKFEREAELFAARMELKARQFEEELAIELGYKSARDQTIEEMEEAHQEAMIRARYKGNDMAQRAVLAVRKFEEAQGAQKVAVLLQQAATLTAGLSTNSKAIFNINKALSLASAIVNTAEGVTEALSHQDYAGAAMIAAMGAAQIATISSTQFGGASSGLTSSGPGTGIPSMSNEMFRPPEVSAADRNNQTIRIEVSADDSEIARLLMRNVRVVTNQEDDTLFSSRSRQALETA